MPGGNDQNLNQAGGMPGENPGEQPAFAGGDVHQPAPFQGGQPQQEAIYPNNGASVDGISNQPIDSVNLGPNEVAPNLAKDADYFTDQTASGASPQSSSPEMQYPTFDETHESSFSPKLIIIIVVSVLVLGGAIGGIVYFFNSRGNAETEEVDLFAEDEGGVTEEGTGNEALPGENTANEPDAAEDPDQVVESTDTVDDADTVEDTIPTPAIEEPQPEPATPDENGAVEGSG